MVPATDWINGRVAPDTSAVRTMRACWMKGVWTDSETGVPQDATASSLPANVYRKRPPQAGKVMTVWDQR